MGSKLQVIALRAELKSAGGDISGRHRRARWSLPLFATFVTFAFLFATLAPPYGSSPALAVVAPGRHGVAQSVTVAGKYSNGASRDDFSVSEPKAAASASASAPAAGVPDPGTAQAVAYEILKSMGMGDDQYSCLVSLWDRESHWNVYASNPSGAYGIPQALPGEKMASAGADWATNPATQVTWGLGYITDRYSTPCGAWSHSENVGWY
ncbi:MAG: transglycosylase SLT domain-containing protein [Rhodoglobus sp.]